MKFFHTADWHLGKLIQGVYMTDDQAYVLEQFIQAVEKEQPDAVIIAGDLYDRAVPPTEAVYLLDNVLERIVLELETPVLAIGGNHDSPSRLNFAHKIMKDKGFHITGQLSKQLEPVILHDEYGEVHFHLIPYADPSTVRNILKEDNIRNHDEATAKIVEEITDKMDKKARHVYVGHAFVTPSGNEQDNTSDSERPLSIGGVEYVSAHHFEVFNYTALGHLHQAHHVSNERIRYAGSILKYSISEEHHQKGFNIVELDENGHISVEKRELTPRRDVRTVETTIEDLLSHHVNGDYVFVSLTDETPILSPMEKIRSVYPHAMHVERKNYFTPSVLENKQSIKRSQMSDVQLFQAFYKEVTGSETSKETLNMFKETLDDLLKEENETT